MYRSLTRLWSRGRLVKRARGKYYKYFVPQQRYLAHSNIEACKFRTQRPWSSLHIPDAEICFDNNTFGALLRIEDVATRQTRPPARAEFDELLLALLIATREQPDPYGLWLECRGFGTLSADSFFADLSAPSLNKIENYCKDLRVPRTGSHGDLNPSNVFTTENGFALIDWDNFSPNGSVYEDVWHNIGRRSFGIWNMGEHLKALTQMYRIDELASKPHPQQSRNGCSASMLPQLCDATGLTIRQGLIFYSVMMLRSQNVTYSKKRKARRIQDVEAFINIL